MQCNWVTKTRLLLLYKSFLLRLSTQQFEVVQGTRSTTLRTTSSLFFLQIGFFFAPLNIIMEGKAVVISAPININMEEKAVFISAEVNFYLYVYWYMSKKLLRWYNLQSVKKPVNKRKVAVQIFAFMYTIYMFILLQDPYFNDNAMLFRRILRDYIRPPIFWYNVVFSGITLIPYIVLIFMKTPDEEYPAVKNNWPLLKHASRLKVSLFTLVMNATNIYNIGTGVSTFIFPVLFWYNSYNLGVISLTAIVLSLFYLCALYLSYKVWGVIIKYVYYSVFDTNTMWKFAIQKLRPYEAI